VKALRRLPLPRFRPTIVSLRRTHAGVPCELLSHRDMSACIKQVPDKRATHVVRRDRMLDRC